MCSIFSISDVSYPEWEKWQATKLMHVALDVYDKQIRAGRYFLHEHPLGASSWLDPRVNALQKRNGVFTVSSPMSCFQAKVETKDSSRDVNKFVYKPTKWMTNSKALAQALGKRLHAGKMEEIRWVKEIGLYKKISGAEAKRRGITVVPIRWVVTDKGDPNRPKVRCRPCGQRVALEDERNRPGSSDLGEPVKCSARSMAKPTPASLRDLKKVARYLLGPTLGSSFVATNVSEVHFKLR